MADGARARRPQFDRERLQARAEVLVGRHRFTIAVVFPLVGATLFVASHEGVLPPPLAFNPLFIIAGTLVMRLPLAVALLPLLDRRALVGLGALTAYTYAVEFVGVTTGLPYGQFAYGVELGPMLFGTVPLGLPAFFLPLVLDAALLVLVFLGPRAVEFPLRFGTTVAVVLAVDLVLDPAAVALGLWRYAADGAYYGVPVSNYLGWLVSATIAVGLVEYAFPWDGLRRRLRTCGFALDDFVSFVLLWGTVNLYFGHWLPVAVVLVLFAGLAGTDRFDFPTPERRSSARR